MVLDFSRDRGGVGERSFADQFTFKVLGRGYRYCHTHSHKAVNTLNTSSSLCVVVVSVSRCIITSYFFIKKINQNQRESIDAECYRKKNNSKLIFRFHLILQRSLNSTVYLNVLMQRS